MCKLCKGDEGFKEELIVLETDLCLVMANLYPIGDYSFLIIPKRHVSSIVDTTKEESDQIMDLQKSLMGEIRRIISPDMNCFVNEGKISGQDIPHLHYHVVARFENDGIENFKRSSAPSVIFEEQLKKHKNIML